MKKSVAAAFIVSIFILSSCKNNSNSICVADDASFNTEVSISNEIILPIESININLNDSCDDFCEVDEQSFCELCNMLYYNNIQIELPCTVSDFLSLDENLYDSSYNANGENYYLQSTRDIYNNNTCICSLNSDDMDGDVFTVSDKYDCLTIKPRTAEFSLFNGDIVVGTGIENVLLYFKNKYNITPIYDFTFRVACKNKIIIIEFYDLSDNNTLTELPAITLCSDKEIGPNCG